MRQLKNLIFYAFGLAVSICFLLFVLLAAGAVNLSDAAVATLGSVTVAIIQLMKILVKKMWRNASHEI